IGGPSLGRIIPSGWEGVKLSAMARARERAQWGWGGPGHGVSGGRTLGRPLPSCHRDGSPWYFCIGPPPNRTSTFRWIRLSSVDHRNPVPHRATAMARLGARSTGHQGLAPPREHRFDPGGYGGPPRPLERFELADVMDL